jgi:hypothetical protein
MKRTEAVKAIALARKFVVMLEKPVISKSLDQRTYEEYVANALFTGPECSVSFSALR